VEVQTVRFTVMLLAFFLSGCVAVQNFGTSIKYSIQGEYYLQEKDYQTGLLTFEPLVKADPFSAEANYYYGRFLLADEQAKKSLPYLERAVGLVPDKSDYHFWFGVALGETGKEKQERKSYYQALRLDSSNTKALTYLGNNLLREKQYSNALGYYQKALALDHFNAQALYNRAYILKQLQREPEERLAWLQYLDAYPAGSFARRAADRLNRLGDYSYRNYKLGLRTITLAEIEFEPFTAELAKKSLPSLDLLGTTVTNMASGKLNILVYQLNNRSLAKKRALSIRNYLVKEFPQLKSNNRIQLSWFDVSEKRNVLKKQLFLDQSVEFFLTEF
jgi:tetratricopeptide (TPR) repeat protein